MTEPPSTARPRAGLTSGHFGEQRLPFPDAREHELHPLGTPEGVEQHQVVGHAVRCEYLTEGEDARLGDANSQTIAKMVTPHNGIQSVY